MLAASSSMHKKGRILPIMHSWVALPQASLEYMKKKMHPIGRILTYMPIQTEIVVVFPKNDV